MKRLIPLNSQASAVTHVDDALSAEEIGSGDLPVLATPMMIALMEKAAFDVVQKYIGPEETTVGTRINVEHLRPTPLGDTITAEAVLLKQEDTRLTFAVQARDSRGQIGQGEHVRVIVGRKGFVGKVYPDSR